MKTKKWIEEEITIVEFVERFLGEYDYSTPAEIDISEHKIKILGRNLKTNKDVYKPIKKFIVKGSVNEYFTDGKLKGTDKHRVIENGKEIHLEDHPDFHKEIGEMKVVDFEIDGNHNYYANGRLNHNTVPGGKAMGFAASVRVRLGSVGAIKNNEKVVIGNNCKAVVTKNRLGPPKRMAMFEIHFDSGIQDLKSWIEYLKDNGFISGTKAGWTFKLAAGEIKLSTAEFVEKVNTDEAFKQEVYMWICNKQIMKYRDPSSKIEEDVTIDDNVVDDD